MAQAAVVRLLSIVQIFGALSFFVIFYDILQSRRFSLSSATEKEKEGCQYLVVGIVISLALGAIGLGLLIYFVNDGGSDNQNTGQYKHHVRDVACDKPERKYSNIQFSMTAETLRNAVLSPHVAHFV